MAYTLPMLYEKYEDQVDVVGEKALIEIKKQYKVIDAKLLSKIPMLSEKKQNWKGAPKVYALDTLTRTQHITNILSFGFAMSTFSNL